MSNLCTLGIADEVRERTVAIQKDLSKKLNEIECLKANLCDSEKLVEENKRLLLINRKLTKDFEANLHLIDMLNSESITNLLHSSNLFYIIVNQLKGRLASDPTMLLSNGYIEKYENIPILSAILIAAQRFGCQHACKPPNNFKRRSDAQIGNTDDHFKCSRTDT